MADFKISQLPRATEAVTGDFMIINKNNATTSRIDVKEFIDELVVGDYLSLKDVGDQTVASTGTTTFNGLIEAGAGVSITGGNGASGSDVGGGIGLTDDGTTTDIYYVPSIDGIRVTKFLNPRKHVTISNSSSPESRNTLSTFSTVDASLVTNNSGPSAGTVGIQSNISLGSDTTTHVSHFVANISTNAQNLNVQNYYGYVSHGVRHGANNYNFYSSGGSNDGSTANYGFYSAGLSIGAGHNNFNFYASGEAPNFFAGDTYIGGTATRNTRELWESTLTEEQKEQLEAGTLAIPANVSTPGDGSFVRQWWYNQQSAEDQALIDSGELEYPQRYQAANFVDTFDLSDTTNITLGKAGYATFNSFIDVGRDGSSFVRFCRPSDGNATGSIGYHTEFLASDENGKFGLRNLSGSGDICFASNSGKLSFQQIDDDGNHTEVASINKNGRGQFGGGVDVTGTSTFDGNIGIGTETPQSFLQVGESPNSIRLNGANLYFDRNASYIDHMGSSHISMRDKDNYTFLKNDYNNGDSRLLFSSKDYVNFYVNNENIMRIFGGSVGIGTISPLKTCHVDGTFGVSGISCFGAVNQQTNNLRDSQTDVNRTAKLQVNSGNGVGSSLGLISYNAAEPGFYAPQIWLAKSNGAVGEDVLVTNNTELGSINFAGNDGNAFINAAQIRSFIEGSATTDSVPANLSFYTNDGSERPTKRMIIDSAGHVGIATDQPLGTLDVYNNDEDEYGIYASGRAPNYFRGRIHAAGGVYSSFNPESTGVAAGDSESYFALSSGTGFFEYYCPSGGGNSATKYVANLDFGVADARNAAVFAQLSLDGTQTRQNGFIAIKGDGSTRINCGVNGDVETVSDYRLKENVVDMASAVDKVKQLRPVTFDFINGNTGVDGFIAHELQDVLSRAVSGTKDAIEAIGTLADYDGTVLQTEVTEPSAEELEYTEETTDDEGVTTQAVRTRTWTPTGTRPLYQGVDQTKLIPMLTKALQEALTEIDNLKSRIEVLEGS